MEKYTYDAYGAPTIFSANNTQLSTSAVGNRFMYTGREWISELGIYDYRHRFYHPGIGRFIETDPTGFEGGDMNLYRYCVDDPVNLTDPTGLSPRIFWEAARHFDSNTEHGTFPEGKYGLQPAGITMGQVSIADKDEGKKSNGNTEKKASLRDQATAALDHWAVWAKDNKKEVAGTINSKGEVIVGPEKRRSLTRSHPGAITSDTVAIWHIQHLVRPNPYVFSYPPHGSDTAVLRRHSDKSHYVGVLNAPPGQFHIFAHTPEMPYLRYVRLGPQPFPQPTDD